MNLFFVFLCSAFLAGHAVHGVSIWAGIANGMGIAGGIVGMTSLGMQLHQSNCCSIFHTKCCCLMYHGGIGRFHSWSSDFRNGNCIDKGGCDLGWKC